MKPAPPVMTVLKMGPPDIGILAVGWLRNGLRLLHTKYNRCWSLGNLWEAKWVSGGIQPIVDIRQLALLIPAD
jgi:hypothetical protein